MKYLIRILTVTATLAMGPAARAEEPTTKPADAAKADAAKAADAKPRPRRFGQTEALTQAIAELTREFREFADKPDGSALRASSDFFKGALPADTTVEDVLHVLNGGMSGSPAQVAYVKWQLLGACPSKFEGSQVKAAFSAYRRAPEPIMAFGGDPQLRSQLDRALQGVKVEDKGKLQAQFAAEKIKSDQVNAPIIEYRAALYQRLPTSPEAMMAGFEDLILRTDRGADTRELLTAVTNDVRSWAAVDARPEQIKAMLGEIGRIKRYKSANVIYSGAITSTLPLKWSLAPRVLSEKALTDLEENLQESAKGGGGPKFKNEKNE